MGIARGEVWTCDAPGCGRTIEGFGGLGWPDGWASWVIVEVTSHPGFNPPGPPEERLTYCPDHRDVKDLIDRGATSMKEESDGD